MKKSRKLTLALAFALVLTVSAAYASLNGTITITGTANLGPDLWVVFCTEDPYPEIGASEDSSHGTMTFTPTVATVTVNLEAPGSTVTFYNIGLRNVGTADARIVDAVPSVASNDIIIGGDLLEISTYGVVLEADGGHGASRWSMTVQWAPGATAAAGTSVTFDVAINFVEEP